MAPGAARRTGHNGIRRVCWRLASHRTSTLLACEYRFKRFIHLRERTILLSRVACSIACAHREKDIVRLHSILLKMVVKLSCSFGGMCNGLERRSSHLRCMMYRKTHTMK